MNPVRYTDEAVGAGAFFARMSQDPSSARMEMTWSDPTGNFITPFAANLV
jgi:hypothetical protein